METLDGGEEVLPEGGELGHSCAVDSVKSTSKLSVDQNQATGVYL